MSTWRSNPLKCSILFNWLGTDKTEKYILFFKITKIQRALWVAEMCVCMRVCEHSWIKQGKTFPVFGWPDIQQTLKWGGGILKSLYATQAGHSLQTLKGLHNSWILPTILVFISGYANTEKVFLLFAWIQSFTVKPLDQIIFTYFR